MTRARKAAVLAVCLFGCAELPPIGLGECGNGVLEPALGEACDGVAAGPGTRCALPEQPNACRFVCSADDRCPVGMGCGVDGVCRRASGVFDESSSAPSPAAMDIGTGDFDGDGRDEAFVFGRRRAEIHFFPSPGRLHEVVSLSRTSGANAVPPLAELTRDGAIDFPLPFQSGYVLALGAADRAPRLTAHPSVIIPPEVVSLHIAALDIFTYPPSDEALLLGKLDTGVAGLASFSLETAAVNIVAITEKGPEELASAIAHGNFDEDPVSSPCEEIAIPFAGDPQLLLMSPCRPLPEGGVELNIGTTPVPLHLTAGSTVACCLLADDVNADGHLDLAVAADDAGGSTELQVAYGVGDGTFHSTSPPPPAAGDMAMSRLSALGTEQLLALGDVSGDGVPDAVTPRTVLISRPGREPELVASTEGADWSEAVIADLNGDGLRDVLAAVGGLPELIFLNNIGNGLFSHFRIPTVAPASRFSAADYDGDRVTDVALAVPATEPGLEDDKDYLAVLFGRPAGPPETPVNMGLLDRVVQIDSGRSGYGVPPTRDGAESAIVMSAAQSGTASVAFFVNAGERVMRAPYGMTRSEDAAVGVESYAAERLVIGRFDGDDQVDVAALAKILAGEEQRLWLTPLESGGSIPVDLSMPSDLLTADLDFGRSMLAAVDLDGDALDELVLAGPGGDDTGRLMVARSAPNLDGRLVWVTEAPENVPERFDRLEVDDFSFEDPPNGRMIAGDVDADGDRDVVILGGTRSDPSTFSVFVYRNDSDGRLRSADALDALSDTPRDIALLNADGDIALEVAVLGTSRVHLVNLDADDEDPRILELPRPARLLASGDVDGDGVDDLVFLGDNVVFAYRGRETGAD